MRMVKLRLKEKREGKATFVVCLVKGICLREIHSLVTVEGDIRPVGEVFAITVGGRASAELLVHT